MLKVNKISIYEKLNSSTPRARVYNTSNILSMSVINGNTNNNLLFIKFNPAYVSKNTPLFSYLSGGNHHNLFKVVQSHDCGTHDSLEHAEWTKRVADACHEERHTWYSADEFTASPTGGRSHSGTGTAEPNRTSADFKQTISHTHKVC